MIIQKYGLIGINVRVNDRIWGHLDIWSAGVYIKGVQCLVWWRYWSRIRMTWDPWRHGFRAGPLQITIYARAAPP